ncbi:MAG: YkgJ family cysteine cluster protein [Hyphomicrobiales bacterium]|nr:YkgJ family cysteine cluster protein [Hyphomicrobiales bacterium]
MADNATRKCGACSLCCKLPHVRELGKSIDTWCQHAKPGRGGCSIYPDRPDSCRGFNCGWLASVDVGDEWFPARCKMIIAVRAPGHSIKDNGMLLTVDPAYPSAWRREPYYGQLLEWAQQFPVEIRVGLRCIGLGASGVEVEVIGTQASLEGREAQP